MRLAQRREQSAAKEESNKFPTSDSQMQEKW